MFYFLFSAFRTASEKKKAKSAKDTEVTSSSGYVYTDYTAKIREAERRKRRS